MAANTGVRSCHATLTANTADTFDLTADGFDFIEIANSGTVVAYFRTDGTTAVVAADETRALLAGERRTLKVGHAGAFNLISVISTGTPTIHVEGF